jgi:3-oxoacyl-[acyl-carrier protein] reductase
MDLGIKDKSVLIVGASKGIGREIALSFAREGCRNLILIARSEKLLLGLVDECKLIGNADFVESKSHDLMNEDANIVASSLLESYGHFDIVVQNIGTSLTPRDPLAKFSDWDYALKLNAGIAIDMNNILIPPMIKAGWGRVIHTSSISAKMLRGNPLYASSKAFLNSYVITTGRAIASTGVVMSAIEPGAVAFPGSYWDVAQTNDLEKCEDFLRHHQSIGRFGSCKEIADVVLFLASNLSSFMPGAIVPVDGANM